MFVNTLGLLLCNLLLLIQFGNTVDLTLMEKKLVVLDDFIGGTQNCNLCTANQTYFKNYVCSSDTSNWQDGFRTFQDPFAAYPVPVKVVQINVTYHGRYRCEKSHDVPSAFVLLNNEFVQYAKFGAPDPGCDCANCAIKFVMPPSEIWSNGFNAFDYGEVNTIQTLIPDYYNNSICLARLELSIGFIKAKPLEINSVFPTNGTVLGGTLITINCSGISQNFTGLSALPKVFCMFGDYQVDARRVNSDTVNCTSPSMSKAQNVSLKIQVDLNGRIYTSNNSDLFQYIATPTDGGIQEVEWILLSAGFGILVFCGLTIVIFKRHSENKRNTKNKVPGISTYLLGYGGSDGPEFKPIDIAEILVLEKVGRGNYGEVFRANWRGTEVAIKKAKVDSDDEEYEEFLEDLIREATILKHPNVLQFLGLANNPPEICLIMEYMPRGSLYKILHTNNLDLPFKMKNKLARDIVRGMHYLHSSEPIVLHRDLKSHNLLVSEHWTVKVCDFGLSRLFESHITINNLTSCGTPCWTAPEVLRNESYTEKCDVYSFGIVLWELLTREDPYPAMPPFQVVFAVGHQGIRPPIPEDAPETWVKLITSCWAENADDRPSFAEILQFLEEENESDSFSSFKNLSSHLLSVDFSQNSINGSRSIDYTSDDDDILTV